MFQCHALTVSTCVSNLVRFKRHLMQPEMSPVLRKSEVAVQLAAMFRKSLYARGQKVKANTSPTNSSTRAREAANAADGRSGGRFTVVV